MASRRPGHPGRWVDKETTVKNTVRLILSAPAVILFMASCQSGNSATATPWPTSARATATATASPRAGAIDTPTRTPGTVVSTTPGSIASPTPTATPAATPTPTPPSPKYGGTITGFVSADPATWDVVTAALGRDLVSQRQLYNGLVQYCPAGAGAASEICPDLARSWSLSSDGTGLIFQLSPGVNWHDGVAFSADDVVFTLNRMLDPKQPSPVSGVLLRPLVQSATAPDPNTVALNLKASSLTVTPTLASAWFVTLAKHVWDRDKAFTEANITGTGPFKFQNHQKGASLEYVRNPGYFHPEWPYLDSVKFLLIPDPSTQAAAFQAGRIQVPDYMAGWTASQWAAMKTALGDKITGEMAPTLSTAAFLMNHTIKPFDDLRVRRAMRIVIDEPEIIEKVYGGAGIAGPVLDPDVHGEYALPYTDIKNLPGVRSPTGDDIAEAKRLLADAGYANGFKVKLQYATSAGQDMRAQFALISAQYQRIGVKFDDAGEDAKTIYSTMARGNYTFAAFLGQAIATPDPQSVFAAFFTQDASLNYSRYSDPVADQLYRDQLATPDQKKRVQLIRNIQRQVLKFEGATSPVRWERGIKGYWSYVKGLRFASTPYDDWTMERVWLDKQ